MPTTFEIAGFTFQTFGLFVFFGFVFLTFATWYEGKKDGFDDERLFDLLFVSLFSSIFFARLFHALLIKLSFMETLEHIVHIGTPGLHYAGLFLGFITPVYIISKRWRWSIFRIFDIFSIAWSLCLSVVMLGYVALQQKFEYIIAFSLWLLLFGIFTLLRNKILKSGLVFSMFLLANVILFYAFFPSPNYLIFYSLLVTLSLSNLYFREKYASYKVPLNLDLLKQLKNRLTSKSKDLGDAAKLIKKEDPYFQEGRTSDNAELTDEVYEDVGHLNAEARQESINKSQQQISKAMEKIAEGTYGICEQCGNKISEDRLQAYPEATTCIKCSEK
ncbi:prolipoprotein diacylglyceryl transferase [candidate division WWE3 bacterium]|uniref:Prolipoprotein diacylglyceryl transferase n=1 Tax=candidate division WWE3 bacterium TaxID=2053526 RepID=A0A955EDX8_UNCKA|nr:prolipoprotein diacylglyceryl transferase [candidate division WWE3 bacterium]